ncbi:MAG: hypothetical protein A3E82_07290 [Gammaproteobacteria bacterium RIFCSPHIGHO2_12_FULL_38_11]|nr:MAG: hypothetical protein A3E82_07290 [Gammaproteobacteria bacterium RIFCSPHIGHO2_12_FULL_38_11]
MRKKLTVSIDADVYKGLYDVIGKRHISHFLENLARPYVIHADLMSAYQEMAANEAREHHATEWSEGLIGDASDADTTW